MAENLIAPTILSAPFAMNGDRNNLPASHSSGSARASIEAGFPPITSEPISQGGVPPTRADFNGFGYLLSTFPYYMQNGGTFTFDPNVAKAIGGYPKNARLWGTDKNGQGFVVRSAKPNNSDNFVAQPAYIGSVENEKNTVGKDTYSVSWIYDIVTPPYVESNYARRDLSNIEIQRIPDGAVHLKGPDVVVETYINGYNWYRIYKSGWIEQGGIDSRSYVWMDGVFHVEMRNTDYAISSSGDLAGISKYTNYFHADDRHVGASNKTLIYWEVRGLAKV